MKNNSESWSVFKMEGKAERENEDVFDVIDVDDNEFVLINVISVVDVIVI